MRRVDALLLLVPVALTSAGAFLLARRRAPPAALPAALARLLECVGLTVVFAVLNALLGAAATFAARAALRRFVSLYLMTDWVLVALSALQAVAFRFWWGSREGT